MNRSFQRHVCLPLVLLICGAVCSSLRAQPATVAQAAPAAKSSAPVLQPPLAFFRQLLAMTPDQRELQYKIWPQEKLAGLRAKIREYETMTPRAREESLIVTELHWYLRQVLQKNSTNPAVQLSQVPEPYRKIVGDRLNQWNILPPPLREEVLTHESTRDFFLLGSRARASALNAQLPIIPPPLREELTRLDNLPPEQRQQSYANFQSFFALGADEKQAVLQTLPAAERQQVEKTIADLDRLPREQRDLALRALNQLAGFSPEQRREFFSNLSRWKQLSPAEQQTWTKLAGHPPLTPLPDLSAIMPPR